MDHTNGTGLLGLLTGPDAGDALAAAVSAAGGRLVSWRPAHVEHQPDRATVSYRARVRWGGSRARPEVLCATAGGPLPAQVTVVGDGERQVGVWRMPHDPKLPGLSAAMDPGAVSALLAGFGLGSGRVRLRLRAYRPRRRAVVEAVGRRGRLFIKVVAPDRAQPLHDRHRLLTAAGLPVPRSLGWSADGLVVLEAAPGRTLREVLRDPRARVPDIGGLPQLLDRLPDDLLGGPTRESWLDRTTHYAEAVAAVMPDLASRVRDLGRTIATESTHGPLVPVHGDLYEAQLMIGAGGRLSGLLDVDTVGPGDRLDDLGCLVGHLSVLAQITPDREAAIGDLGAACLRQFEREVDPRQLRLRVAAVVMSLAPGPHRVQDPGWPRATVDRVDLIERWIDSANRAAPRGETPR